MSTTDYPNQEALNKALNIYRTYMRAFIINHLKKINGRGTVEDIVINSVNDWRGDKIDRILNEPGRDIKSIIDIDDFPPLVVGERGANWNEAFKGPLKDDKDFQNQLWLIKTCRDQSWAHPPEGDAESEGTRVYLFLIAEVLGKISKPDQQREVETIRDELFFDNTAERLTEAEERLKVSERENAKYKKSLTEAERRLEARESERDEYEKDNTTLSKQVDEEEKYLKKLSKQLKRARAENDKYKKNLAGTKQRLEKSEAAQADYKKRLEVALEELKDTKEESRAPEESLTAAEEHLLTSVAKRYIAETTEEDRNGVARQVAELRINASGSRPLRWPSIREKLGLKKDEFHKVIRPSKGYRTAVIDRIKSLKGSGKGWEYSGKLEFLTGIDISESDLA